MPFCRLSLRAPRDPDFPIAYARNPRTLGEHIRKTRLLRGLRQRDLAATLGVRSETVANWEKGRGRPLVRHHAAVIRFLGGDPESTPASISGRLRAIRRRLGLTQADLAAKVGLDEGSLCRWESGARKPSHWMEARVTAILDAIESGESPAALGYYDLTRWRRRTGLGAVAEAKTFGERLRGRRLELGMSAISVARQTGTSRGTLYRIERGRQVASEDLETRLRMLLKLNDDA